MDPSSLFLLLFVGVCVFLVVASRRVVRPKVVTLRGPVPPVPDWLGQALARSATWSATPWDHDVYEGVDEDGNATHYVGVLKNRQGIDEIHVTAPLHHVHKEFAKPDGLPLVVTLEEYRYRSAWQYRLLLGKYPENHVLRARGRVITQLRRQARKAARQAFASSS